jgi:hypothetical protein
MIQMTEKFGYPRVMNMSQIKGKNAINRLCHVLDDTGDYMVDQDVQLVQDHIKYYQEQYDRGMFAPEYSGKCYHMPWSTYNFRYQHLSVIGFTGEVLAAGKWNKNIKGTRLRLNQGDKQNELRGGDLLASKDGWSRDYLVQVKTVKSIDRFEVQNRWFKYSGVDRFVIADVVHSAVAYFDYNSLSSYCADKRYVDIESLKKHVKRCFVLR